MLLLKMGEYFNVVYKIKRVKHAKALDEFIH